MSDGKNSAPPEHRQDGSWLRRADNFVREAANAVTFGYADKISGYANGLIDAAINHRSPRESIRQHLAAEEQYTKQVQAHDPHMTSAGHVVGFGLSIVSGLEAVQAIREFHLAQGSVRAVVAVAASRAAISVPGAKAVMTVNNAVGGARSIPPALEDAYRLVVEGLSSPATPKISGSVGANIHHP